MKLRTKFVVGLLLVTVVLSGAVYAGLGLYKAQLVDQAQGEVNQTASLTARQLDHAISDRKDFVGYVASRPRASQFNESDRFLRAFVENSRFFAAQVVDDNGTVVDFHGDVTKELQQESIGSNISGRPYVSHPLDGQVYVGKPEYANSTGKYLVIFSAPIFEGQQLKGALAAAMYLDRQTLFGVLGPISRADQRVTVSSGATTIYASGGHFDQAIEASRTVESTDWTVTVDRNRVGLISQLRGIAIAQGLGIALVMLAAVVFGMWEYRTTLAQTRQLLEGFGALEAGEFGYEISLTAAEEWEQISDGFNALARSLAGREAAIRQREERLQVLNRVLRHNLRNSAAVVLGYAEIIRDRSDDEEVLAATATIEQAGAELESISEKARQLELTVEEHTEPSTIDVAAIVEEVITGIRADFPDTTVTVTAPPVAWVEGRSTLGMAIENVCENACMHNDAATPRLDLTVERREDVVTVQVADNGAGIPEHEREVINAGEETPLEHGSGLGLWVAKWAVEQAGGTIDFEVSEPRGSTVTIELRRAEPADARGADE